MNLTANSLFVGLFFGTLGFAYLSYGRKRPAPLFAVAGIFLMGYSYFVESLAWNIGIGVVLLMVPFLVRG